MCCSGCAGEGLFRHVVSRRPLRAPSPYGRGVAPPCPERQGTNSVHTTVRQCAYVGLIQQSDARRILHSIEEDLDDGTLLHQPLDWTGSLRRAEEVAERQAWTKPCRSLDLWHVAAALELKAEAFVTFDNDQFSLARTEGLRSNMPR